MIIFKHILKILMPLHMAHFDKFEGSAYNVNGYTFWTLMDEQGMKTQNSGLFCKFGTKSYVNFIVTYKLFKEIPPLLFISERT